MRAINTHKKILQSDWLAIHPYKKPVKSDFYFINLANRILGYIYGFEEKKILAQGEAKKMALHTTAYFEDVISGLGLWQAFTRKHKDMYGKYLPFYELDESYVHEEINLSDLNFLVWKTAQDGKTYEAKSGTVLNPENPILWSIALGIYTILEDEYETAPANIVLESFFSEPTLYDNFFEFRELASWLFYDSYLFCDYTQNMLKDAQTDSSDVYQSDEWEVNRDIFEYTLRSSFVFDEPCGPLALKLHYWLAAMVGEDTVIGKRLLAMDSRGLKNHYYLIDGETTDALILKPHDGGKNMLLAKSSYNPEFAYSKDYRTIQAYLVYFDGYWHVNGALLSSDSKIFPKATKEFEKIKKAQEKFTKQLLKANNNKPIFFFGNMPEMKNYMIKKVYKSANDIYDTSAEIDKHTNIMAFVDSVDGLIHYADMALAIKDPTNPYYDKEEAFDIGAQFFFSDYSCSRSLIDYIVTNKLMPDMGLNSLHGEEYGVMQVQDNLEFLFRFFKPCVFKK